MNKEDIAPDDLLEIKECEREIIRFMKFGREKYPRLGFAVVLFSKSVEEIIRCTGSLDTAASIMEEGFKVSVSLASEELTEDQ